MMNFALSATETPVSGALETSSPSAPWVGRVDDENPDRDIAVNLRGGDGENYKILSVLKEGRHVLVHETRGTWLRVELIESRIPVWVKKDFFSRTSPESEKAVCTAERVVMREGALTNSTALGLLSAGQQVTVIKEVNGWLQIEAPVGTTAWISGKYVKAVAEGQEILARLGQGTGPDQPAVEASETEQEVTPAAPQEVMEDRKKENQEIDTDLDRIRREFEARLQELQANRARNLDAIDAMAGLSNYTASGKVVASSGAQAGHFLELGGRTTFWLKPALDKDNNPLVEIERFLGRDVGISGRIVDRDGVRWIEVERIELLSSPQ